MMRDYDKNAPLQKTIRNEFSDGGSYDEISRCICQLDMTRF